MGETFDTTQVVHGSNYNLMTLPTIRYILSPRLQYRGPLFHAQFHTPSSKIPWGTALCRQHPRVRGPGIKQ